MQFGSKSKFFGKDHKSYYHFKMSSDFIFLPIKL